MLIKINMLIAFLICLSCAAFAQENESTQEKIVGEKSHNGVSRKMSPEEVEQKIADKKKMREAKKSLKSDGKYSKEDRKKMRKMKRAARKADVSEDKKEIPPPGKDTQQMIDEADADADQEDPQME